MLFEESPGELLDTDIVDQYDGEMLSVEAYKLLTRRLVVERASVCATRREKGDQSLIVWWVNYTRGM